MGMKWKCIGKLAEMHWKCIGNGVEMQWRCNEDAMLLQRQCIGNAMECTGNALKLNWNRAEPNRSTRLVNFIELQIDDELIPIDLKLTAD